MVSQNKIILKPIGFVQTESQGDEVRDRSRLSKILIYHELIQALDGIAEFSHIFVLFWLDKVTSKERKTLKIHPRGRLDMPLLGVFATRTNHRPNPLGLTLCELINVENNFLTVRGLDAFNGTPVIDVKPYDSWDCATKARTPNWWMKLNRERKHGATLFKHKEGKP